MTDWSAVLSMISDIEDRAARAEDRGLEHGTTADIVQAQMALGCKRGMAELRRMIRDRIEVEKRVLAANEAARQRRSRKHATQDVPTVLPITATGSQGD